MSVARQRRRGTTANHAAFTGLAGEVTIDTDKKTAVVHDGATAGGFPLKRDNVSATDRLLGRDTASAGAIEEITVGGGVEFTGSGGIQRSALTGDVTATAGSGATTIANDAVTYAKMQNVSATDKILGRSTAGAGDVEEITCTAAGRALLDDAAASDQRTTLGFGTDLLRETVVFYANATAGGTLTDVAAAAAFLGKSNRNIQEFDATDFTQCRISVRITTPATSGTQLRVLYRRVADTFSTTLTDHITIGTSDVIASLNTAGIRTSSWIDLAASAKNPIFIAIEQSGGDAATDPVIAFLTVQFRRR